MGNELPLDTRIAAAILVFVSQLRCEKSYTIISVEAKISLKSLRRFSRGGVEDSITMIREGGLVQLNIVIIMVYGELEEVQDTMNPHSESHSMFLRISGNVTLSPL
jgi:hypothetical protein